MTTKPMWPAAELRITKSQAEFLATGRPSSFSAKLSILTEESLSRRKMIGWVLLPNGYGALRPSPKGRAALEKYYGHKNVAANDNQKGETNAA